MKTLKAIMLIIVGLVLIVAIIAMSYNYFVFDKDIKVFEALFVLICYMMLDKDVEKY